MAYQSVNPFSGKLLKRFDQHTDLQMESALATADRRRVEHVGAKPAADLDGPLIV